MSTQASENTEAKTADKSVQVSQLSEGRILQADADYKRDSDERLKRIETLVESLVTGQNNLDAELKNLDAGLKNLDAELKNLDAGLKNVEIGQKTLEIAQKNTDELLKTSMQQTHKGGVKEFKTITAKSDEKQGFIRFVFNIESLQSAPDQTLYSYRIKVGGAKWYLWVRKQKSGEVDCLAVYLRCERMLPSVNYEANVAFCLFGSTKNVSLKLKRCYKEDTGWGWPSFLTWAEFSNYSNGFLNKIGDAIVEVTFDFNAATDAESLKLLNAHDSIPYKSDGVLIIEGLRIKVNKGLLSVYSSYFDTLFNGDFSEKNNEEIELKDVLVSEFLLLRNVIYPSRYRNEITEANVECLLRMADMFLVQNVTERCEDYLKECAIDKISLAKKLVLAQDYRLIELKSDCLEKCKTAADILRLKRTKEYAMLGDKIKGLLMDNLVK